MPESRLRILLDQNLSREVVPWLERQRPLWEVWHVKDVGLAGKPDAEVFKWAQAERAIIVTYDEDFADTRTFALGAHCGVIRLRVWPTTVENTREAIRRLLAVVSEDQLFGSLIIIDPGKIRLRRARRL
jgi:predicted nuclease of predicted toxin-antitoxin system